MKQIETEAQAREAMQAKGLNVLVWSSSWCPDCIYLASFIQSIIAANPEFTFYKLNPDGLIDLAQQQGILGIPSFTVYKDGREVGRFVSKLRKTPEEIQQFLDECKEK